MNLKKQPDHEAFLILENGQKFSGRSFGYPGVAAGEVVFSTAMTGYPESLTDPSYCGQILVATYPLIGNYGVPALDSSGEVAQQLESDQIHVSGLIIGGQPKGYSHWNAAQDLSQWLSNEGIPGIYGIDTRALTQMLREYGCMKAKIVYNDLDIAWYDPEIHNLVEQVSTKKKTIYGKGSLKIILVDCGVKYNIIRSLLKFDTTVVRVPYDYDYTNEEYDGLFISNGPGDPVKCVQAINHLRKAIQQEKPIFGICLGSQLLAIAAGARTYKLRYGHRSHNQPVIQEGTNKCYVTSQNHGYAVDPQGLPKDWKPFFYNLNDHSCEGIIHCSKPFFATQFHPEASGGPTDTTFLFDLFIENIIKTKTKA